MSKDGNFLIAVQTRIFEFVSIASLAGCAWCVFAGAFGESGTLFSLPLCDECLSTSIVTKSCSDSAGSEAEELTILRFTWIRNTIDTTRPKIMIKERVVDRPKLFLRFDVNGNFIVFRGTILLSLTISFRHHPVLSYRIIQSTRMLMLLLSTCDECLSLWSSLRERFRLAGQLVP